jgi:hypothetical protein
MGKIIMNYMFINNVNMIPKCCFTKKNTWGGQTYMFGEYQKGEHHIKNAEKQWFKTADNKTGMLASGRCRINEVSITHTSED